MNDNDFRQLLIQSDPGAAPALRPALADRVLKRSQRRQRQRRWAYGAAAGGMVAAVAAMLAMPARPRHSRAPMAKTPAPTGVFHQDDRVELMVAQETVDAMRAARRSPFVVHEHDALARMQCQANASAAFLVAVADQMRNDPASARSAAEQYRLVIKDFPHSPAAAVAAERLRKMKSEGGVL